MKQRADATTIVIDEGASMVALTPRRILIIEDERDLAKVLERQLAGCGYSVSLAFDGESGLQAARSRAHDLILLDIMLPGIDGIEVCRRLRQKGGYTPILMLSAKSTEGDRIVGLDEGADDYLTKPFAIAELIARVKAIFRRVDALGESSDDSAEPIDIGGELCIDPRTRGVEVRGRPVKLTRKEFDLLWHFARNPGRVYSRAELLDAVWGYSHDGYEHAINCQINRLRAKIEVDHAHPRLLLTVWGVGYKLAGEISG
jgi:DNA-binding response OmpR family regulator